MFDRGVADALNIRLGRTGAETGSIRMLGGQWPVQFEVIDINLVADQSVSWAARAAFVKDPTLAMPFQGLLGTDGFLDRFVVTFNKYYDYFLIEQPGSWEERAPSGFDAAAMADDDPQWQRPGI
ncbi:MAG: hypothetical protein QOE45_3219 [Frankiaceae bacterium]|nr:hypothetical protein [Frankiaceae bacterium]